MSKQEFLDKLRQGLSSLPKTDVEERIAFYSEMIDDRIEEGKTEEEAVETVGSADEIAAQIAEDMANVKHSKKQSAKNRKLKAWEIVLISVGSPLWIALGAVALALVITAYAVLWSVVVAIWAVPVALIACFPISIFALVLQCIAGNVLSGLALLGIGVTAAGLAIFAGYGCLKATKGTAVLSKIIFLWIRSMFVRKENAQ